MSKQHEMDVLIGHADEHDGIDEYDNLVPGWMQWLFISTIIGGVWMLVDWHVVTPRTLAGDYDAYVAWAVETWGEFAPREVVVDEAHIQAGAALFATNCVACHMADATGGIGPNLTDSEWINGGTPDQINHTIFYGVNGKGMPAWGGVLGPDNAATLAAYVVSLGGAQTGN